ncbi:MAG TPA: hypothetical protein PLB97_05695 [Accumulibacter sp.]|nr:hypothetical protein [Accumulibacter sp.]
MTEQAISLNSTQISRAPSSSREIFGSAKRLSNGTYPLKFDEPNSSGHSVPKQATFTDDPISLKKIVVACFGQEADRHRPDVPPLPTKSPHFLHPQGQCHRRVNRSIDERFIDNGKHQVKSCQKKAFMLH